MVPGLFFNLKRALVPLMHDDTYETMHRVAEEIDQNGRNPKGRLPAPKGVGARAAKRAAAAARLTDNSTDRVSGAAEHGNESGDGFNGKPVEEAGRVTGSIQHRSATGTDTVKGSGNEEADGAPSKRPRSEGEGVDVQRPFVAIDSMNVVNSEGGDVDQWGSVAAVTTAGITETCVGESAFSMGADGDDNASDDDLEEEAGAKDLPVCVPGGYCAPCYELM